MASLFQWLDHSDQERRKALDVIQSFQEQETRDELGVGAVRDAFADLMFPGTSTIQTRARYFLFIPWLYLDLERRGTSSAEFAKRARAAEIKLIDALAVSDDSDGTIGIDARRSLKRLPSNIYWQGLAQWGIRLFPGSQEQHHRDVDSMRAARRLEPRPDEGDAVHSESGSWHRGLPEPPSGFPDKASFQLLRKEAEYLRERVLARHPLTLLAFLLEAGRAPADVEFPWQHPDLARFPPRHQEQLGHARNFAELMHGAALLYNLMLAEKVPSEEWATAYRTRLADWAGRIDERRSEFRRWPRARFWDLVVAVRGPVSLATRRFIDRWIDVALETPATAIAKTGGFLIEERERMLKGTQARLQNRRALERWNGAAGAAQLNFRWRISHQIITDIQQPSVRPAGNA